MRKKEKHKFSKIYIFIGLIVIVFFVNSVIPAANGKEKKILFPHIDGSVEGRNLQTENQKNRFLADFYQVGLSGMEITHIVVNYKDSSKIWVRGLDKNIRNHVIYRTIDNGEHWTPLPENISEPLFLHPTNPDLLFRNNPWEGLFRSIDGGDTWVQVNNFRRREYAIHITDPNIWYMGETPRENTPYIYKSRDGGNSWESIYQSAKLLNCIHSDCGGCESIVIHPAKPSCIISTFVISNGADHPDQEPTEFHHSIISRDGGTSWKKLPINIYKNRLAFDINAPLIYCVDEKGNLMKSNDEGYHWQIIPFPYRLNKCVLSDSILQIDPNRPGSLYVGTWENGLYFSPDRGATWQRITPLKGICSLGWDKSNSILYIGADNGLYALWRPISVPDVKIASPAENEPLAGTTTIRGTADDNLGIDKIEIDVDNEKLADLPGNKAKHLDFSWNWDTRDFSFGNHTVKIIAFNTGGYTTKMIRNVKIVNLGFDIQAKRINDRGWLVRKHAAKIDVQVQNRGGLDLGQVTYTLIRTPFDANCTSEQETSLAIKTFSEKDLKNMTYSFSDFFPSQNGKYKYQVLGYNASGTLIGSSVLTPCI